MNLTGLNNDIRSSRMNIHIVLTYSIRLANTSCLVDEAMDLSLVQLRYQAYDSNRIEHTGIKPVPIELGSDTATD